jgi:hypothetical protein
MVVSPDFSDSVVYDFKEKSAKIISTYGLTHLRGTEKMDPATKLAAEFINLAKQSSTNPNMTDSMLQSEQRMYLKTMEQKVLEISQSQARALNGLRAQALGQPIIADANWESTINSVAKEVDRIAVVNSSTINTLSKQEQEMVDGMFASVVDRVRAHHGRDPSANSAAYAEKEASKNLKNVERQLSKIAKDSLKNRQNQLATDYAGQLDRYLSTFSQMKKAMKPDEVKAANQHVSNIKTMIRTFKSNSGMVKNPHLLENHIASIQEEFRRLNEIEGNVSETISAVAGIFGGTSRRTNKSHFAIGGVGSMTAYSELETRHPERTNPAHIRSMQYFMNQGQTFEQAHESSKAYGFNPEGGVRYMDLDQRVNYLGKVPVTVENKDTHILKESSDGRKGLNVVGAGVGSVGTLVILTGLGLIAYKVTRTNEKDGR